MASFPPIGGGELAVCGGVVAKVQTHWGEKSPKMALLAEWVCDLAESIAVVVRCSHVNPLLRVLTRYLECGRGCPSLH